MQLVPTLLFSEIVAGMIVSTMLILLTIVHATRTSLKKHNFALLFLFIAGLCHTVSYIILFRDADEYTPCRVDTFTFVTFYLMRLGVMTIYYLRIAPMMGAKSWYPARLNWLCVPLVLSSFMVPMGLRLWTGEGINWCSWNFFLIIICSRTIPSFAFLVLFLAPLCRFIDGELRKLIWKHGSFFALDVAVEAAFLITDSDWNSDVNVVSIDAYSMILQQVILVLMFNDAKYFYFPCFYKADWEINEGLERYYYSSLENMSKNTTLDESLLRIRSQRTMMCLSNSEIIEQEPL